MYTRNLYTRKYRNTCSYKYRNTCSYTDICSYSNLGTVIEPHAVTWIRYPVDGECGNAQYR